MFPDTLLSMFFFLKKPKHTVDGRNFEYIYQAIINQDQLAESINKAESWPNSASFQWIWGDQIKVLIVIEESYEKEHCHEELIRDLPFEKQLNKSI